MRLLLWCTGLGIGRHAVGIQAFDQAQPLRNLVLYHLLVFVAFTQFFHFVEPFNALVDFLQNCAKPYLM